MIMLVLLLWKVSINRSVAEIIDVGRSLRPTDRLGQLQRASWQSIHKLQGSYQQGRGLGRNRQVEDAAVEIEINTSRSDIRELNVITQSPLWAISALRLQTAAGRAGTQRESGFTGGLDPQHHIVNDDHIIGYFQVWRVFFCRGLLLLLFRTGRVHHAGSPSQREPHKVS